MTEPIILTGTFGPRSRSSCMFSKHSIFGSIKRETLWLQQKKNQEAFEAAGTSRTSNSSIKKLRKFKLFALKLEILAFKNRKIAGM